MSGLGTSFGSGAMTNSIEDLAKAKAFFIIGSNTTEQHPVIGALKRAPCAKAPNSSWPIPGALSWRASPPCTCATNRSDLALLNGMAHVIIKEGLYDKEYVASRTEGFEELKSLVQKYTPAYVESITGVAAADLENAARLYATNRPAAILYSMGITQHTTAGHVTVMAIANLAMLTGNVRCGGWRRQPPARPEQRPGRLRHGRPTQRLPRLPEGRQRESGQDREGLGRSRYQTSPG